MSDLLSEVHTEASRICGLLVQRGDFQGRLYLADEIVKLRHAWEDGHASGRCEASTECASLKARLKEAEDAMLDVVTREDVHSVSCGWRVCQEGHDPDHINIQECRCDCYLKRFTAFLRSATK